MIAPSRTRRAAFVALLGALAAACGDSGSEPDDDPRTTEAGEFVFLAHEGVSDSDVARILEALRGNADRIEGHMRVTAMPRVRVSLWAQSHRDDWNRAMKAATGQLYAGATGYTPASDEMRLLLNPASPLESVHEYAHLVSWQANPTIPNNPRWLWEAVAVYEAGSAPDLRTWSEAELTFPGLQALNQYDTPLPYRWGFHIAQAVIARWGDDGYVSLIRTNGNLQSALGITEAAFGAYVEEFVRGVAGRR
jgi:hypothetical protein